MKILHLILLIFFLSACQNNKIKNEKNNLASNSSTSNNYLKRYGIRSGIIKYKTNFKGKMMGSTIDGNGAEELYFKNWGALELKKTDSKQITHINIFGQKKTEINEEHKIEKLDKGKSYSVDLKNKIIYVRKDPAIEFIKKSNNGDVEEIAKKMLESMGGEKIGNEKILNYPCEVWKIPGGKEWIYKGIPLKLEMKLMGITTTTIATEAQFDINIANKYFELPDYPIQEIQNFSDENFNIDEEQMKEGAKQIKKMSFESYKEMIKKENPEEFKNISEKELKTGYDIMQKMAEQFKEE